MSYATNKNVIQAANAAIRGTEEPLTFALDYNDGSAVDPPAGVVFTNQAEITAFLTAEGATNFKHLMGIWDALPGSIEHAVTINAAAGVHRPRLTEAAGTAFAFPMFGREFSGGYLHVIGNSSFDAVSGPLTGLSITGVQLASGDPYLDFAGTPFNGLDLRGLMVQLSTGQHLVIHDHTDSRLNLTRSLDPDPTGGTATVVRPSTIFRNSQDDIAVAYTSGLIRLRSYGPQATFSPAGATTGSGSVSAHVLFDRCRLDTWSVTFGALTDRLSVVGATQCMIDWEVQQSLFSVTPNGRGFQAGSESRLVLQDCGFKAPLASGVDESVYTSSDTTVTFQRCVSYGGQDGIYVNGPNAFINANASVVAQKTATAMQLRRAAQAIFQAVGVNSLPFTIRDIAGDGIDIQGGEIRDVSSGAMKIDNCTGSAIVLNANAAANLATYTVTGTGNGDAGVTLAGTHATATLGSGVTVTGTNGDVGSEGTYTSYATVSSDGPLVDGRLNFVEVV